MTSHNLHGITRIELRDARALPDGGFYRTICLFDRDGNRHDITLFADVADVLSFHFWSKKETAE